MPNPASQRARIATSSAVVLLACLACSASAAVNRQIPLRELVPSKAELPGFARASTKVWSTTSPLAWANRGEVSAPRGENPVKYLRAEGFQEGIDKGFFLLPSREAVAGASVYASPGGAQHELGASVAEAMRTFEQAGLQRSTVPGIPGSVMLGSFRAGHRGGTGNVFFATGRCLLTIGNRALDATSRTQANRAPVSAAKTLYRRVRPICG